MQPAPAQGLETWGRKQRQAWRKAIAPALGSDISSSYLPCPGTCLCLCFLCSSVYPCHALSPHRPNELHCDIKKMHELPWVDFIEYEVKPYGDAYSLSPLDGAKSCSPPLCLRAGKSLLKLSLGAKEAS